MTSSGTFIVIMLLQATSPVPDRSTTTGFAAGNYAALKGFIMRSVEKMPADHFAYQPTLEVRTFGGVLAHIADANYLLCAPALGEPSPNGSVMNKIEKESLAREPLLSKLKESFAFCDRAYETLTEANAQERVPFFDNQRTRVGLLWFHISHAYEHYGNLVTYLRLKGIVPPSSEPPRATSR